MWWWSIQKTLQRPIRYPSYSLFASFRLLSTTESTISNSTSKYKRKSKNTVELPNDDDDYDVQEFDNVADFEAAIAAATASNGARVISEEEDTSQRTSTGRNKRLMEIARIGIRQLDKSAAEIQKNPITHRDLFATESEQREPKPKQIAEEYRVFTTAQDCLEYICTKDPTFPLMAGEEPVQLVGCKVNAAMTYADIFWCLPGSLLTNPTLSQRQLSLLREEMHERLQGAPGRRVAHCVSLKLSYYFPPKVRFQHAHEEIVQEIIDEYNE